MGREDPMLLLRGEASVERRDLDGVTEAVRERVSRIADLALAGEEDEDVTVGVAQELSDGAAHRVDLVDVVVRSIAHLDGEGPP